MYNEFPDVHNLLTTNIVISPLESFSDQMSSKQKWSKPKKSTPSNRSTAGILGPDLVHTINEPSERTVFR